MLNIQETINANVSENTQSVVQNVALFGAGVAVGVALDKAFCWARGKYAAYKIGKAEVEAAVAPKAETQPEAETKAEAQAEAKPEAEVKTEAQPEAQAEAKAEAQPEAQAEVQAEAQSEAQAEDNK